MEFTHIESIEKRKKSDLLVLPYWKDKQKTFLAQWLQDLEENAKVKMLKQELGDGYETLQQVKNLQRYQGAQARMPFGMELK